MPGGGAGDTGPVSTTDPFTGAGRYVPGGSGSTGSANGPGLGAADPFTGESVSCVVEIKEFCVVSNLLKVGCCLMF